MYYILKMSPEAKSDIITMIDEFSKLKSSKETQFLLQLGETLDYLGSNPKLFPRIYKNIRQAKVSQFPFNVFFMVEESDQNVIILAVLSENDISPISETIK